MSKINEAFKNGKAFIPFLTAGDPSIDKTEEFIIKMAEAGADLIEIGIPFSDPIAEGKVIESANGRALKAGATTDKVFDMVKRVREKTNIPLVFLTYINPIFVYGKEKFFKMSKECGIDGVIIPDLPFEEMDEVAEEIREFGIDLITLVAPTSEDRIAKLTKDAKGFIYLVSSMGVTGVRSDIKTNLSEITEKIRKITDTPIAVGFGISTKEQAKEISEICDGVIVGSAIVKIIEEHGDCAGEYLAEYVGGIKGEIVK